ncbi:glycosyltransferase [Phycicoccus sp. Root101]|uniref:CgeB family protein n=1 Tax=Phycicoccus sp. Root101 TaxID=1736421 RepID=UPI0007028FF2|nr:glycosyltransferase [Phycicoccus sp. Root101]KQU68199.1 hypothetical protein ASC58_11575 [Phycicoccus sp. Root101]
MTSSDIYFDDSRTGPDLISVPEDGISFHLPVNLEGVALDIAMDITTKDGAGSEVRSKALVASVRFDDAQGRPLPAPSDWLLSRKFGPFRYVAAPGSDSLTINPPLGTRNLTVTLVPWEGSRHDILVRNAVVAREVPVTPVEKPSSPVPTEIDLSPSARSSWQHTNATPPVSFPVIGGQDFVLDVRIRLTAPNGSTRPPALLSVRWFDAQGNLVPSRGRISINQQRGEFRYLKNASDSPNLCLLQPPLSATTGVVHVERWGAPSGALEVRRHATLMFRGRVGRPQRRGPLRPPTDIRVAIVCDEFTYNSFDPEFDLLPLDPGTWREQLEASPPDLFFCESAWTGPDPVSRPWRGRVYASKNFPRENRHELFGIIEYCRERGIPTVFWNKEDPSHYPDRQHDFVKTALLFDHILTTAIECVERYRDDYGHRDVHCLPFATQPKHFNPIETQPRTDEVVFAGSWYRQHPERSRAMEEIFDGLIDAGHHVHVRNRHHGDVDPNHQFPDRYQQLLHPAVTHRELADLYKSSRFGLNINTEVGSKSMFARRVFELMSSNTLVLSNYSAGMQEMFGDTVVFVDRDPERLRKLSSHEVDELRERALKQVLERHTYAHRARQVLDIAGVPYSVPENRPVVAVMVNSQEEGDVAVRHYPFLASHTAGLLLVLGEGVDQIDVRGYYRRWNRGSVRVVDARLVQHGSSLNLHGIDTVLMTHDLASLTRDLIDRVVLHGQYAPKPLAIADDISQRYTRTQGNGAPPTHVALTPEDLVQTLVGGKPDTYYLI